MKNTLKIFGIAALIVAIGLLTVSCGGDKDGASDITIIITEIPGKYIDYEAVVSLSYSTMTPYFSYDYGGDDYDKYRIVIKGASATFNMYKAPIGANEDGTYKVNLQFGKGEDWYEQSSSTTAGYQTKEEIKIKKGKNTIPYSNFEKIYENID